MTTTITRFTFTFALLTALGSAHAAPVISPNPRTASGIATMFPPNNLHREDRFFAVSAVNERQFNAIIDRALEVYGPIVEGHGAQLVINKHWSKSDVNAGAHQNRPGVWAVEMYGGLARRPEVDLDGFTLVLCHEIGHHLGGFPFKSTVGWAASEGQSDYFTNLTCTRALWAGDPANAQARQGVHPLAKTQCDRVWNAPRDRDLCYRAANATASLGALLGALDRDKKVPTFETPDTTIIAQTNFADYPGTQCRMDTYFAGALCRKVFDPKKIPGKKHPAGQTSLAAERESELYSCSKNRREEAAGARPSCWFKARF